MLFRPRIARWLPDSYELVGGGTGPDTREETVAYLMRTLGPLLPCGPLQTVRPLTPLGMITSSLMGALAIFCGASDNEAAGLMRRVIRAVETGSKLPGEVGVIDADNWDDWPDDDR